MICFADTDRENYSIHTFLGKKEHWKNYLILVLIRKEDQILMAKQIHRAHLDGVDWLLTSKEEFTSLLEQYKDHSLFDLVVMELTMTGDKSDAYTIHNWQMLAIDHEPKTDPFDDAFAKVMNDMLDQMLFNYNEESKTHQKRIDRLCLDLMASGMFQMLADPSKVIGE
jgi:hypothetical protein